MRVLKRKIVIDEKLRTADDNMGEYLPKSQASFNSDNCITIRNYDIGDGRDEIIILSPTETNAIFLLFSSIGEKTKNYTLPF